MLARSSFKMLLVWTTELVSILGASRARLSLDRASVRAACMPPVQKNILDNCGFRMSLSHRFPMSFLLALS